MARDKVVRKHKYVKKDKKDRLNRKGWMEGKREDTMLPYVPAFAQAIDNGWQAAAVSLKHILNVFHFHFPYTLADEEEPATIVEYDAKKAAEANDESKLSQEELLKKRDIIEEQNKSIRRWLVYRAKAYRKHFRKLTKRNANDTYEIFMARLCGITKSPKQPHAVHIFEREKKAEVAAEVTRAWGKVTNKKRDNPSVAFYDNVARGMMKKLPAEESEQYKTMAIEEGTKNKAEYKRRLTEPPSKTPEDRAAAVANLKGFLGDVQRGCEERTFLRIFSLVGGPMSETNGEFDTFSVVVSKNNADVPLTFPEFWGDEKMTELVNAFKDYLVTCYSGEEKKSVIVPGQVTTDNATAGGSTSPSTSSTTTQPGAPTSGDAQMIDINSLEGLKSLFDEVSDDDDDSSSESDSDESEEGEAEEGTKKRKRGSKSSGRGNGKGKAVKRSKVVQGDKRGNEKGGDKENAPARPKEPRKSNYEIERDRLVLRKDVALIGLNDYHAKGMVTEGVEWEDFVAHGFKLIASGEARDPALPPPTPPSKPRPKPRQKTAASTTTERTLRSSTTSNVNSSGNAVTATLGGGTGEQREVEKVLEGNVGMQEGVISAGGAVDGGGVISGEGDVDGVNATKEPISIEDAKMPDSNATPLPDAGIDLMKGKIDALKVDAPGWLKDAVAEFIVADGGNEMVPVLLLLLEIEREHGWTSVEKGKAYNLPGKHMRPAILTTWINNGRTRTGKRVVLVEADADKLATAWGAWWAELQEKWRMRGEDGLWKRGVYGDEWKKLVAPGQNGILSVVAVLSWWTSYCSTPEGAEKEELAKACAEARVDVEWVLRGLVDKLRAEHGVKET